MNTVATILQAALDSFEDGEKWVQGIHATPEGHKCSETAVWDAACSVSVAHATEARDAVRTVIVEQYPERTTKLGTPFLFNDHPDTTFDDVRVVFEKAIAEASR